jgi:hypothetical protein
MAWDFETETEPEFQARLDWADAFVREEVEPLDLLWPDLVFTPPDDTLRKVIDPLKQAVRARGLWATHLGLELGGQGYGQLKLSLLNEIALTGSTSARSTGGRRSLTGSRAGKSPASTRRPRGCACTSRSISSPAPCTATTSSPT